MNKKFSTLVAALLVSGVSYAVVGTFNAPSMASSAIAASANLRSNTLLPAASQLVLKKTSFAEATKWKLVKMSGKDSKYMLVTVATPTCFLTATGTLSNDIADAAEVKLAATTGYLQIGTDYAIEKADGSIGVVAIADLTAGDKLLNLYSDESTPVISAGEISGLVIANAFNAWNTATDIVAQAKLGDVVEKWALSAQGVVDNGKTITVATDPQNTGKKVIQVAAGKYVKADLTITDAISEAAALSVDEVSKAVKLGDNYLYVTVDGVVSVATYDAKKAADLVYAYGSSSNGAVNNVGLTGDLYLVRGEAGADFSSTVNVCFLNFTSTTPVSLAAGKIDNVYSATQTDKDVFTGESTNKLKLTIGGEAYYLRAKANSGDCELELSKTDGQNTFALESGTNELKINNGFVVREIATGKYFTKANVPATGYAKVYLYEVNTDVVGTSAATSLSTDSYVLGEKLATAPTNVNQVNSANYNISASTGVLMALENGSNYKISKDADANFLTSSKDADGKFVLSNSAAFSTSKEQKESLWTVGEVKNLNGRVTNYTLTNKETGKALAFNVKPSTTIGGVWTIEYAADGKYKEFFIDEEGRISFEVNEKNIQFTDGHRYSNTNSYSLNYDAVNGWTAVEYSVSTQTLKVAKAPAIPVTGDELDKQVSWLNVTAGTGKGFDVIVKNAKGDKITPVENALTQQTLTAVRGPQLDHLYKVNESESVTVTSCELPTLNGKIFFKVEGDYQYQAYTKAKDVAEGSLADIQAKHALAKSQLADFRNSKFIVVDTLLYSSLIDDTYKNFYKFAVAKGSELISAKGYVATHNDNDQSITYANFIDPKGNYVGVKLSIENAGFKVSHLSGDEIVDPIQIALEAKPYFPLTTAGYKNQKGVWEHAAHTENFSVAVKEINGTYYVGAHTSPYSFIYAGVSNDVDYTKVFGIVNIYNAKYNNKGEILGNTADNKFHWFAPQYVNADAPEGQFLVSWDKVKGVFSFTNRESQNQLYRNTSLKTVKDKDGNIIDNVYAVVYASSAYVTPDTIKIVAAENGGKYDGYFNKYSADELKNKVFNLSLKSGVEGMDDIFVMEDHENENHLLRLTKDSIDGGKFRLVKFEAADKDSIYVSVSTEENPVKYVVADGTEKDDYVVAFTYAIYNETTKEFVTFNKATNANYLYCDANAHYATDTDANVAQRFIIKEKANGVQLIPVWNRGAIERFQDIWAGKAYAATYTENKVGIENHIYKITDNDLFQLTEANAAMYYKFENAYDTVRIYKADMTNDMTALYAKTADKSVVSGEHFLSMDHQVDVAKAKFSFFVDTAYVRDNTYKPQYLLAIDAVKANKLEDCDVPGHEPHDTGVVDTVYGKFLVNMVDSISVWGSKHSNPYWFDNKAYARLGFVNAKHTGDSLIIVRDDAKQQTKADTIYLGNNDNKIGAYAFRYVNADSEKFVIETAYKNQYDGSISTGYIKWLNGTPVVVNDMSIAEVFELKHTESTPTANENTPVVSSISVAAIDGAVIVKGAAGKTVVITNILGQTIANVVLSSDNETIAAPAGVVVVAVEGEAAVKAIVK